MNTLNVREWNDGDDRTDRWTDTQTENILIICHYRVAGYKEGFHFMCMCESIFHFRYVRLYYIDSPKEKWLNYLQTVEILIRRRVPRRLIWVCTVCQLPV